MTRVTISAGIWAPCTRLVRRAASSRAARTSGVEPGQGRLEGLTRHPGGGQVHAVETGRVLTNRVGAAAPDVVADRADARDGRLDVGRGPGQDAF